MTYFPFFLFRLTTSVAVASLSPEVPAPVKSKNVNMYFTTPSQVTLSHKHMQD